MANFIAFEIQKEHLVVAAARSTGRRMQLEQAELIPVADHSTEVLAEALKSFLARHRLAKCEAMGVVARKDAEIRIVEVPPAPDNELPDMVRFKARSDFGAFNDNWALDFIPASDDATKPRDVMATAVAPEHVSRFADVCESSGVKLKHILLKPFSTVDLLRSRLMDGKPRLIIDESDSDWNLTVTRGCQILVTRSVKKVSEDAGKHLVNHAKRTLAAVNKGLEGEEVVEVVTTGDMDGLSDAITTGLGIPCEPVDPFQIVPSRNRMERPGNASHFSGVLGALLQHDSGLGHEIDYLNPRKIEVKTINYRRMGVLLGIAAAALLGLGALGWWVLNSQANELEFLNAQLQKAQEDNTGMVNGEQLRPSSDQIIGEVGVIDKWKSSDFNWLDELSEISDRFMTPDQVIVDSFEASLSRDNPSIRVEGRIANSETDKTVRENLIARPYRVISPKSTGTGDSQYQQSYEYTLTPEKNLQATIKSMDVQTREFIKELRRQLKAQRQSSSSP